MWPIVNFRTAQLPASKVSHEKDHGKDNLSQASASGDPHLVNARGEKFDILNTAMEGRTFLQSLDLQATSPPKYVDTATPTCPSGYRMMNSEAECREYAIQSVAVVGDDCAWGEAENSSSSNFREVNHADQRPVWRWTESAPALEGNDHCVYWAPDHVGRVTSYHTPGHTDQRSICIAEAPAVASAGPPPTAVADTKPAVASTGPPAMSATGDPHLVNIRGEHFSVFTSGQVEFIRMPWESMTEKADLAVHATIQSFNETNTCKRDLYITGMLFGGSWFKGKPLEVNVDFIHPGATRKEMKVFLGGVPVLPSTGPIDLGNKMALHMYDNNKILLIVDEASVAVDLHYFFLNVKADSFSKLSQKIGGLLGEDDHSAYSMKPAGCEDEVLLAKAGLPIYSSARMSA